MSVRDKMRAIIVVLGILIAPWGFAVQQVDTDVQITRTGFLYNRQTDTFDTAVTISNRSAVPLAAPMRLVLESVRPVSVSLYNIYGKTDTGKAYVYVPLPGYVLQPGSTVKVPVRFVNMGKNVTEANFSLQAERLNQTSRARLDIHAVKDADNGAGSVGPGFNIKVDDVLRGLTDKNGNASLMVPLNSAFVTVTSPPNYYGATSVSGLVAGAARSVSVTVGDSGEFGADSVLRIDKLQHFMLPNDVQQIVLRFFQDEKPVASDLIELVELRDPAGAAPVDITSLFSVRADGSLAANPTAFWGAVGSLAGKKLLFAQVLDKQGVPYLQEVPFYISRFNVHGKLVVPPSNSRLALGRVPIQISILNTDIVFDTESTVDGSFPLPRLPAGNVSINATLSSGGVTYVGQGVAVVSGNSIIELKMLGPTDVENNVSPISITSF